MLKKTITTLSIICLLLLAHGCAINRAKANLTPGADLTKLKNFYVIEVQKDMETNKVCKLIEENLSKRGYSVKTGPELPLPYKSDIVLTYNDKWFWDITMYMIELTITFRDPANNFPMAVGNSVHTSLTRKSPPEMVDEVLTNIFNAKPSP
jgi:hypothetical protein